MYPGTRYKRGAALAYPNLYGVTYSYAGFQQSQQGISAFPGTQIDADLAGLSGSVSNLALFVRGVMRSDGALNNGVVTYDSLSASLQAAGLAPANPWASATAYLVGNSVVINSTLYRCLVAHTSGVFATDLAAGKWLLIVALQAGTPGIPGTGFLSTKTLGCPGDGSDQTVAFQAAVNAAANGALYVDGVIGLSAVINLPSNILLFGLRPTDGFQALGAVSFQTGMLQGVNQTGIKIRGLTFRGNFVEPVAFSTGAIYFAIDQNAVVDSTHLEVSGCTFSSFKTSHWVWFVIAANVGAINNFRHIKVQNNFIDAEIGCAPTFAQAGVNGNTFVKFTANVLLGNTLGLGSGCISDVVVSGNTCIGFGLSGLCQGFTNCQDFTVCGNATHYMGNNTIPADRSYTYLFYNSNPASADPVNISIFGNTGWGHHSNAVYLAGARNSSVTGNTFSWTAPSGVEPTLPHGAAIALNGTMACVVSANTLIDSLGGVAIVGVSFRAGLNTISGNIVRSTVAATVGQAPYGVLMSGDPGNVDTTTVVAGNNISLTGTGSVGIIVAGGVGVYLGRLVVQGNSIAALTYGIWSNGISNVRDFLLTNNFIYGAIQSAGISLNVSGPLFMLHNTVDCADQLAGGNFGALIASDNLTLNGIIVKNNLFGTAFGGSGVTSGRLSNVSLINCATPVAALSIGLAKPTFSAFAGDRVQNLNPAELGAAASKYVVREWLCTGTVNWLDQRMLTGN